MSWLRAFLFNIAFFGVTADHDYAIAAARRTPRHFLTDPARAACDERILDA